LFESDREVLVRDLLNGLGASRKEQSATARPLLVPYRIWPRFACTRAWRQALRGSG
jgi:hypothetical protein